MTYGPQHVDAVELVESILRINKEEAPVFGSLMLLPQLIDSMDTSLYASLEACTELVYSTCFLGFHA